MTELNLEQRINALEHNFNVVSIQYFKNILTLQNKTTKEIGNYSIKNNVETINVKNSKINKIKLTNNSDSTVIINNFSINDKIIASSAKNLFDYIVGILDKDIEKNILKIYNFIKNNIEWDYPLNLTEEISEPLKLFYIYGRGLCDDQAAALITLVKFLGVEGRLWALGPPGYHVVAELFYNNKWHLFDPDGGCYYEKEHILSLQEIRNDLSLLDKNYTNRYDVSLIKSQFCTAETIREITDKYKFLDNFELNWKLLPGMNLSYSDFNYVPICTKGYDNKLPEYINLAEWSQEIDGVLSEDLVLESSFPFVFLELKMEGRKFEYSINNNPFLTKNIYDGKGCLLFDEEITYDLKIRAGVKNLQYKLYSRINQAMFPFVRLGENKIKLGANQENIDIDLRAYWSL